MQALEKDIKFIKRVKGIVISTYGLTEITSFFEKFMQKYTMYANKLYVYHISYYSRETVVLIDSGISNRIEKGEHSKIEFILELFFDIEECKILQNQGNRYYYRDIGSVGILPKEEAAALKPGSFRLNTEKSFLEYKKFNKNLNLFGIKYIKEFGLSEEYFTNNAGWGFDDYCINSADSKIVCFQEGPQIRLYNKNVIPYILFKTSNIQLIKSYLKENNYKIKFGINDIRIELSGIELRFEE